MHFYEMEVLRIVCFDLTLDEPYSICASYCNKINGKYFLSKIILIK